MLTNYIKVALRCLMTNKLYTIINTLGLGIGLSICILITLYVKDELSFDQFQTNKNEIYRLICDEINPDGSINKIGVSGKVQGLKFKEQVPEIDKLVRIQGERFNIKHTNEILVQEASKVDSSFFDVFDSEFTEGNSDNVLSNPQSIVISEKVAKRFFGESKALGKSLQIDYDGDFQHFTVVGVVKASPLNSSIQIELLMPIHRDQKQDDQWINFYMNTFFTLKEGTNLASLEKKLAKVYEVDAKDQIADALKQWDYKGKLVWKLQPFLDMHLSKEYQAQNGIKNSGNKLFSFFLSGIALFILFIACINFVNISISRSMQRAKEIGVRKVVGSQRSQLIFQFMTESAIQSLGAFLTAILFVNLALPTFNELAQKSLAFSYLYDTKLVLAFVALFALTCFLAGFYPAMVLSSFKPVDTLYGRFRLSGKNILQKSLTVMQFGLASLFIILTIFQYQQVNLFLQQDLGYDDNNLMKVNTGSISRSKANTFVNEILKNPNIKSVAPSNQGNWFTQSEVNNEQQISNGMFVIDEKYIHTYDLKIIEGRNFSIDFSADTSSSILVNEAYVKEAGWKDPIGQTITFRNKDKYQVVGVVRDYHFESLYGKIRPQTFVNDPNKMSDFGSFHIRMSGQNDPATMAYVKEKFKEFMPAKPYDYEIVKDVNDKEYEKEIQMRQIILWATLITIFISCIGLFGLSALATQRRFKEIGVRKIMGASVQGIVKTLTLDFLNLIVIAFVLAAPLAYYLAKTMLANYPYRIEISWKVFFITALMMLILGFLTVSYQAIRAAMMNPVKSLKTE